MPVSIGQQGGLIVHELAAADMVHVAQPTHQANNTQRCRPKPLVEFHSASCLSVCSAKVLKHFSRAFPDAPRQTFRIAGVLHPAVHPSKRAAGRFRKPWQPCCDTFAGAPLYVREGIIRLVVERVAFVRHGNNDGPTSGQHGHMDIHPADCFSEVGAGIIPGLAAGWPGACHGGIHPRAGPDPYAGQAVRPASRAHWYLPVRPLSDLPGMSR